MTNEEINNAFFAQMKGEGEDFEAALDQVPAAQPRKLKDNGLSYFGDEVNAAFGTVASVYALRVDSKTLLWVKVDLSCTVEAPQGIHYSDKAVSWHPIYVQSADGLQSADTTGRAVLAQHKDGVHIDGVSVASFIAPRAGRWIAKFYGV